jgi:hypothetical protein
MMLCVCLPCRFPFRCPMLLAPALPLHALISGVLFDLLRPPLRRKLHPTGLRREGKMRLSRASSSRSSSVGPPGTTSVAHDLGRELYLRSPAGGLHPTVSSEDGKKMCGGRRLVREIRRVLDGVDWTTNDRWDPLADVSPNSQLLHQTDFCYFPLLLFHYP